MHIWFTVAQFSSNITEFSFGTSFVFLHDPKFHAQWDSGLDDLNSLFNQTTNMVN
jgi:hypothetical protein